MGITNNKLVMIILGLWLGTGYVCSSVLTKTWDPIKSTSIIKKYLQKYAEKEFEKRENLLKYKSELTNYFDTNNNGLSINEQHQLYTLMGIQDSSINYAPTLEDWERGYIEAFPERAQE